jgi:acyl-CoA thioesterase-1
MSAISALRRHWTYGHLARRGKAAAVILGLALGTPAMAETTQVLALGDSLTQGYGLPAKDGLVPQLERWLQARGHDVKIVNGGVSGDTTRGGLARVSWSLTQGMDAMIVTLGGNDILRGVDPAETRSNLDGILQIGQSKGVEMLVIGLYASQNYGADYKKAFDRIHPELAETYGALYEPNYFQALIGDDGDPSAYVKYMQMDGIHPKAVGVARIVERIGPRVEELIGRVETRAEG